MGEPIIHGINHPYSDDSLKEAVGTRLLQIKNSRALSYKDLGRYLGKSDDQIVKYIGGEADMPMTAFIRGGSALGFIDTALAFVGHRTTLMGAVCTTDPALQTRVAQVALRVAQATAPDSPGGVAVTRREACEMLPDLDLLQASIDRLRAVANGKLAVAA